MNKLNKKGFTLVELVIVIAVIAILAAVLIPTFSGAIQKANQSAVLQAARSAYEEKLALDLADGILDGKEYSKTDKAKVVDSESYITITVNEGDSDYTSFEYRDVSKNLKATYDGQQWTVEKINN